MAKKVARGRSVDNVKKFLYRIGGAEYKGGVRE